MLGKFTFVYRRILNNNNNTCAEPMAFPVLYVIVKSGPAEGGWCRVEISMLRGVGIPLLTIEEIPENKYSRNI